MKFFIEGKQFLFYICLVSLGVTGCVQVGVNGGLTGDSSNCEFDRNTGQVICADSCEKTYAHTVTVAKSESLDVLTPEVVNSILDEGQSAALEDEGFPGSPGVGCQLSLKLSPGGLNIIIAPNTDGGTDTDGDGSTDLTQSQGGEGMFESRQDDTVNTEWEYITLMQRPEWVKAVKSLYVCGLVGQGIVIRNYPSHFSGCSSDYPHKLSIVEYDGLLPIAYHGSLWLHEIGHTRGNKDTWEQDDSWVMYGAPSENSKKLSCRECARFLLP